MARNDGTGVTRLVAQHAAALAFDALPRELVDLVKQIVLDTIGVVIGASGLAPEARIVAEYVEALGGRAESTVFGFGFKGPAPWAAFVNGSLGHMLDYDDVGGGGQCEYPDRPRCLCRGGKAWPRIGTRPDCPHRGRPRFAYPPRPRSQIARLDHDRREVCGAAVRFSLRGHHGGTAARLRPRADREFPRHPLHLGQRQPQEGGRRLHGSPVDASRL